MPADASTARRRPTSLRRGARLLAIVVLAAAALSAVALAGPGAPTGALRGQAGAPPSTAPPPPTTAPPSTIAPTQAVALPLTGCPPPPPKPGSGTPVVPWRPPRLVPEAQLPAATPPPPVAVGTGALEGKGMWVWKYRQSEGGDADAIVARAVGAGLRQLWVRVGDSRDGFYGADVLDSLVPKAHAAGLAVIGWGFPFLHDPEADAAWSMEAVSWRGPGGARLDGFSPDIELASEGVVLTERRITLYLGLVRAAAPDMLMVATVYRATDVRWNGSYPYRAIAPYVDAFAPMVYWGCVEPGQAAQQSIERLAALRPVHVIGQGYDMAPEGGRAGPPSAEETVRFLDVARRGGAVGASFWVWHFMGDEQWDTIASFVWPIDP